MTNAGAQFGKPGYEIDLLYLACLATLVLGGSGPCSVDGGLVSLKRKRDIKRRSPTARIARFDDSGQP